MGSWMYLFVDRDVNLYTCLGTALENLVQTELLIVERRSLEKLRKVSSIPKSAAAHIPAQVIATSQRCKSSLLLAPVLLQQPT